MQIMQVQSVSNVTPAQSFKALKISPKLMKQAEEKYSKEVINGVTDQLKNTKNVHVTIGEDLIPRLEIYGKNTYSETINSWELLKNILKVEAIEHNQGEKVSHWIKFNSADEALKAYQKLNTNNDLERTAKIAELVEKEWMGFGENTTKRSSKPDPGFIIDTFDDGMYGA